MTLQTLWEPSAALSRGAVWESAGGSMWLGLGLGPLLNCQFKRLSPAGNSLFTANHKYPTEFFFIFPNWFFALGNLDYFSFLLLSFLKLGQFPKNDVNHWDS